MSENENGENHSQEATGKARENASKTFTQEDVNRLIAKEKAKYKGYSEIKAKADKYDDLEASRKTDLEKANERAENAEAKLAQYESKERVESWKSAASKATGVPASLLRGSTEEEVMEHAESLKEHFSTDAAPEVQSDGFAPDPGSEKSSKDLFASAIEGII
ncbi:DUF4355 domain-containing protein [Paraeggerthella hongkongensis]|uniref:DUF4355 domain-containing protein n=1 Tax=Paraeggerthella hongkongensis TaxID=230658 RepID=A0A3N0BBK4_9ACTN|nr:DUF4355 domain-containing protein [Paraeggerthella hongkongensis]RNL44740.1 hypothetical protein DMP08_05995 [Paraeggerthella hongkongensis]